MVRVVKAAIWIFVLSYLTLCGIRFSHVNYDEALASGRGLPLIVRFERAFPGSTHFITYYFRGGDPRWNSKAGFGGRYVLSVQFPIELNWSGSSLVAQGPPLFFFTEVTRIDRDRHSQRVMYVEYARSSELSPAQAEQLIATQGNVVASGIAVTSARPVEHFDVAWKQGGL